MPLGGEAEGAVNARVPPLLLRTAQGNTFRHGTQLEMDLEIDAPDFIRCCSMGHVLG